MQSRKSEMRKAYQALKALPPDERMAYIPHFRCDEEREFVGLVCAHCENWVEYGHESDCLVKVMLKWRGEKV